MNQHNMNVLRNMPKFPKVALVVLLLALLMVAAAYAASPGSLDTTFDTDGKVTTSFGSEDDYGYAVAIQADGKIVVAGFSDSGSNTAFALARYNSDGSLDTTFGAGGKVTTPIGSNGDAGYAVAIQADGKIVVVGESNSGGGYDFALARYTITGTLDTTFDTDGKVTTSFGSSHNFGYAVAIQADGKIVVAGFSYIGSDYDFAVARYTITGTLDSTFDSDGKVTTPIGSSDDKVRAVAIQADGKIVVAGRSYGSNIDFALARYNSDGSLDTTFDTDGKVTTPIGSSDDYGQAVAIQADGKIVVAGYSYGSNIDFALARYNSDGSLDTTFDTDGKVTTPISSGNDFGWAVAIQADGKIVVAGYSDSGSYNYDFALARYNSNGSLDTTFDTDGKVTTPIGSSGDFGQAVAIQADGKIVMAGGSSNGSNDDFALARYDVAESAGETVPNDGTSTTLPGVSITNHSGGSCDFTVVKNPVPPGGAPADTGEMPSQWNITTTACSPLTVTLVFSYTDTEWANGNGITEENLVAFRNTGGTTWTNQCSPSGPYTCTLDIGANTLTVSNVTALSSWTLGDPTDNTPTAIRLQNFAARTGVNAPVVLPVGVAVLGLVAIGVALALRRRFGQSVTGNR